MKTYQLVLVPAGQQWWQLEYREESFGEFRTSSKRKLQDALTAAASGAVANASGYQYVVARYKGRNVDAAMIYPR